MKRCLIVVLFLFCLAIGGEAVLADDMTWYPGSLSLGLDARALGMGGACLAVLDSWTYPANPAALVYLGAQGFMVGRFVDPFTEYDLNSLQADGDQLYLYLSYFNANEGNGAYSLSVFQNSYVYAYYGADDYYHTYTAIQYGYGYPLNDRISLGFNLRRLETSDTAPVGSPPDPMMHYESSVMTGDIGAVYRLNESFAVSVLVTDILSPKVEFVTIDDITYYYVIQAKILFGGSFRLGDLLLVAVDVDYNIAGYNDLINQVRFGAELRPLPFLAVRAGLYHGQTTVGFGFKFGSSDGLQACLDFGEIWPGNGEFLSPVQNMQLSIYF